MFSSLDRTSKPYFSKPGWLSVAAHLAALVIAVTYRPSPIFVTPSSLAMGNGDKSYKIVYFAPAGAMNEPEPDERKTLQLVQPKTKSSHKHKQQEFQQPSIVADRQDATNKDAHAGSAYGSLFTGPVDGHDVRPAYPVVFPDPPVDRSDFPAGFQGDVIVEVTIDKLGNVIDLKLLQGIGGGVDEKVMATLRNWRYKPAMMDGEPIAEKHDVHFHYPS